MVNGKIQTISILGPTASGKTSLALEVASRIGGEIVSCDSMLLYRDMNIGTAKPTCEEMRAIPHHMINIISAEEDFSVADYTEMASEIISEIKSRNKVPIICGGTFLYHDSLMNIKSFNTEIPSDDSIRKELYEISEIQGREFLHEMLREIDPESAEKIHFNNVKRVVRAIEIFKLTGKTKTEIDKEQISDDPFYDDRLFVISFDDRGILYERINKRVDEMISSGLENEAKYFTDKWDALGTTARQAIGYKEFIPYFSGEKTKDEITEDIKLATRHYAKRQMIWLRRYKKAHILTADVNGEIRSVRELADELITNI